jgi:amino acid adenylation domain-containing protein
MSSNPTLEAAAFRLSSQQERAWLEHDRGLPQFAQCVIKIEGALDVERLRAVLQSAVEKYEILRTVLRRQTGVKLPFQVIQDKAAFAWSNAAADAILDDLLKNGRAARDGAEAGLPLRALLVPVEGGHILALTLLAFLVDGASLKNLFGEIARGYSGKHSESDDVMQYADLVEWQNELLTSDESKPGRDFWRELCRGIDFASLESRNLPLEKKEDGPFEFASVAVVFRSARLEEFADELRTSAEAVLLAGWNALLARLAGAPDVTLACEFDGRRYEELATAIGPLARSLPLRFEVAPLRSFSDLVQVVGSALNEARNWQESFAWNNVTGVESPVLPLAFCLSDIGTSEDAGGVGFTLERVQMVSERFKLRLNVVRRGSEMTLEFHYDAARFELSAVERIAGYYQNLLAAALASPATPVSRLPLLSEAERKQLLVEWNQTAAAYPDDKCLHELFEQQAARVPDRMAVRCGEQTLTYQEVNEHANQLAHYLRRQGVGPDQRVGLCLDRSTAMMVAVLGILKAGGAYVPLNADNPPARLKQQLEGARALITESKLAAQMPEFSGTTVVLDRDEKLWADEPKSTPTVNTTPENLVYVIFTSGSTGVPKGVAVRHRNLVNYADFITKKLKLDKYPEGLQFATVSTLGADLGNTCIYPALISGGSLHILPHETATDPQQFANYTSQHPIDVLKIVPSHLQALLQSRSEEAGKILPRKYLFTGGEALTPKLLEKISSLNPRCEILNHYGPTETTVGSLTLELKHYDWKTAGLATIPIGRPIQNTQTYILDQNLEPVPVGVTGELYIAGAGVTAGYLGQPEKTAERFIRNPFSEDSEARMYRTGDLARYGEDGNIEFLGRGDDQVKIRGFRIELGEIESVLGQHPAVKQAVVLARASGASNEDKRLLAYVVLHREATSSANGHGTITSEGLRQHLQQHLPDYMVPQAVMLLAKLPLNANGKLDRQALPEPEQTASQKTYIAPRTATEQTIAEVWAEVLRRDKSKISADDNFFDLGGHSLLATQVVSRLRQRFLVEIPMRAIFDRPTPAGLAESVDRAQALPIETEEIGITRAPREAYRVSK